MSKVDSKDSSGSPNAMAATVDSGSRPVVGSGGRSGANLDADADTVLRDSGADKVADDETSFLTGDSPATYGNDDTAGQSDSDQTEQS